MASLDLGSNIPLYVQLAFVLQEQLFAGQLRQGALVPSEGQLEREFGVSRQTARSAVRILRDWGWVTTQRSRGTRVLPWPGPRVIEVPPGNVVRARMPTAAERAAGMLDAVPLLVISGPGRSEVADATRAVVITTAG